MNQLLTPIVKALRNPLAKLITRAVGYGLAVVYARAGIESAEAGADAAALSEAIVAAVMALLTAGADLLHHRADRAR
jgi:hypothetical protein